ncbi:MAG: hypothetical protein E6J86_02390 [Deltaproteobacteria bacterium]|nr:MAG: hypothetical protein E6J86_02390 [Deltaproteobacteria bacterium]
MFRTIATAAMAFAVAAYALHRTTIAGRLEEPLLLLFMGTLFLIVGKVFSGRPAKKTAQAATQLVERRAA